MTKQRGSLPEAMVTGETSIRFSFGANLDKETNEKVRKLCKILKEDTGLFIEEIVPSYHTVTIYSKKEMRNPDKEIERLLSKWVNCKEEVTKIHVRKLYIPVCYDDAFSLDMERVQKHTQLSRNEIISLHANQTYTVYMIGFLPGFPYLGKLNEKLVTPRLNSPRSKVARGTVGIGNNQTGIYPLDCPGGWNIIGRTPLDIYLPNRKEPFFIQAGDELDFVPISMEEFEKISNELRANPESINQFMKE